GRSRRRTSRATRCGTRSATTSLSPAGSRCGPTRRPGCAATCTGWATGSTSRSARRAPSTPSSSTGSTARSGAAPRTTGRITGSRGDTSCCIVATLRRRTSAHCGAGWMGVAPAHGSCFHTEPVRPPIRPLLPFPSIVLAAALGLGVAIGCDSPFEPRGEGERVPIGQVIEQEVTGDSARQYTFAARANGEYAVFLEALQGTVVLVVVDSVHHAPVASVSASQGGAPLEDNPTDNFGTPTGAVYQLRVSTLPRGASARFRFKVYAINTAPEKVRARFAIGDTVSGETIDPSVDGDRFFAHGTAGQDVVLVMETLGPQGSGSVSLTVVDTVTPTLLGYVFGDAGTPTLTTGRLRLPASHDYLF